MATSTEEVSIAAGANLSHWNDNWLISVFKEILKRLKNFFSLKVKTWPKASLPIAITSSRASAEISEPSRPTTCNKE